ncbi:MAG TPA: hypothetical protein VM574_12855, partial [Terrimicrobiaceae bacterium]|nr:hypothetical protein [Terrimicrobiaceae bacterium]
MVTAQPPGDTSGARELTKNPPIRTVMGSSPTPVDWKAHRSVPTQSLPVAATSPIFTYAELQQRIHHDL